MGTKPKHRVYRNRAWRRVCLALALFTIYFFNLLGEAGFGRFSPSGNFYISFRLTRIYIWQGFRPAPKTKWDADIFLYGGGPLDAWHDNYNQLVFPWLSVNPTRGSQTLVIPLTFLPMLPLTSSACWFLMARRERLKITCRKCGYPIAGLTTNTCPECGRTITKPCSNSPQSA